MTNLTTTLEKSKELKLAGWRKETYFYWIDTHYDGWKLQDIESPVFLGRILKSISSPTITELLEELDNKTLIDYAFLKGSAYSLHNDMIDLFRSPDKLADCWIFAKKEGLIK
jgi:hypothetical protein